jgi:hypothetical protein
MSRGTNCSPSHTGFIAERTTPRIATCGGLTSGVKLVPPIPPSDEIVNTDPLMSFGASLPARAARQLGQLAGELEDPLAVDVVHDGDDEAVRRVGREAEVALVLDDELVAVERGGEARERVERRRARLEQQGDHRHLHVVLLGVELLAERLEVGDVRLVVVGDERDLRPRRGEVRRRALLDAGERDALLALLGRRRGLRRRRAPPSLAPCTSSGRIRPCAPSPPP